MLVLTRRAGEAILIGRDVDIIVLETDGTRVRLGIRAPRELTVLRRELLEQVGAENRRATAGAADELLAALRAGPIAPLGE